MRAKRKSLLYAAAAVFLWSTVATAFKLSLRYLTPIELLFFSSIFSTVVIGAILLIQGKLHLVLKCSRSEYQLSIILGFLNPFLYYLILFKAYDLLPAQQAQPINYTWAITLSLLSVPLLKQKIVAHQWLALIISYFGVVVISTEGKLLAMQFTNPLGVTLALISTVVWSLYWIYNTRDKRDPVVGLFLNFLFGFCFVLVFYLLIGKPRLVPIEGLLGAVYVGFFEMGICFVLWLLAMKLTDNSSRIANLIFLSPFLSLIFIHYLVGERIVPATYFGLLLIICGLIIQQKKGS